MTDKYAELRAALDAVPCVKWTASRATVHIPETEDWAGKDLSITGLDKQVARKLARYIADTHPVAIRALLAERDQYARVLDGLPQDAIDGGWTAAGMSAHAKTLEAENERLRETLETIANTKTRPGDEKAGLLLASAINLASVAVTQQEQS